MMCLHVALVHLQLTNESSGYGYGGVLREDKKALAWIPLTWTHPPRRQRGVLMKMADLTLPSTTKKHSDYGTTSEELADHSIWELNSKIHRRHRKP
jgi:hypothetical protein